VVEAEEVWVEESVDTVVGEKENASEEGQGGDAVVEETGILASFDSKVGAWLIDEEEAEG
jgi:hypothetical protein